MSLFKCDLQKRGWERGETLLRVTKLGNCGEPMITHIMKDTAQEEENQNILFGKFLVIF